MTEAEAARRRGLRQLLEDDLRLLAATGLMPDRGAREVTFHVDAAGSIKWFSTRRVRVPAGELERA